MCNTHDQLNSKPALHPATLKESIDKCTNLYIIYIYVQYIYTHIYICIYACICVYVHVRWPPTAQVLPRSPVRASLAPGAAAAARAGARATKGLILDDWARFQIFRSVIYSIVWYSI